MGASRGQVYLPWFHKSSIVECFSTKDRTYRRPLGEDAYTYKLQLEGFADTVLHGQPMHGANVDDGIAAMRALVAIARSSGNRRSRVFVGRDRGCVMQLGIFAKTFARRPVEENLDAVHAHGFQCVQYNLVCAGLPTLPESIDAALCDRIRQALAQRNLSMAAVSGTFNIIDPDDRATADVLSTSADPGRGLSSTGHFGYYALHWYV